MGLECDCKLRLGGCASAGRAQLETDFVLFRGAERLKVQLRDLTAVQAKDGVLRLEFPGGPAELDLGAAAAKWADKILHPPTLFEKLGVKPGISIAIEGDFDAEFRRQAGPTSKCKVDLLFYAASQTSDLARLARLQTRLNRAGAIWVVFPKGVQVIREKEVIEAGRAAGLKDTKVARFSQTHTALRFSRPARESS
jgi:hypothetical protein